MKKESKQEEVTELSELYQQPARLAQAKGERFGPASSQRNLWHYHAAAGSTVEQYLQPSFWRLLERRLRPLDRIEIVEELGEWFAEIIVKSIGPDGVEVGLIRHSVVGGAGPVGAKRPLTPGYRINFGGAFQKWCVFGGDRLLMSGFPTETAANGWMDDHIAVSAKSNPGAAA